MTMKNFKLIPLNVITLTLIIMSLILMGQASAKESTIQPFIKGSFEQIQKEHQDKPYIIAFWSETCGYCMKELALFGKLLKRHPGVEIVTISTDPFLNDDTVNRILSSKNLQDVQKWVFADNYAARLYSDVDPKWRGELPLTYFFDANNQKLKHMGTINKQELIAWFTEQSNAVLK